MLALGTQSEDKQEPVTAGHHLVRTGPSFDGTVHRRAAPTDPIDSIAPLTLPTSTEDARWPASPPDEAFTRGSALSQDPSAANQPSGCPHTQRHSVVSPVFLHPTCLLQNLQTNQSNYHTARRCRHRLRLQQLFFRAPKMGARYNVHPVLSIG